MVFFRSASENGVRILLDGTDGDTTVSHGFDYLVMLAKQAQWATFSNEVKSVKEKFDNPRYANTQGILYTYAGPQLAALARQGEWIKLFSGSRELANSFDLSTRKIVINWGIKPLIPSSLIFRLRQFLGKTSTVKELPGVISEGYAKSINFGE